MRKVHKKTYNIRRVFGEVVRVSPLQFFLQYVLAVVSSVFLGLFIVQLQNVFDHAAIVVESASADGVWSLLCSLLILFLYKAGSESLEIANGYLGNDFYNRCAAYFLDLYNQNIAKMRAITFEENDNLKLYRNALTGATSARGMLHVIMDIFTLYIPYFLTIIFYLAKQDASLLAIVPLVAIPIFITNQIKKKNYQRLHKHTIHPKRKKEEYTKYLSEFPFLKEVRVKEAFRFFYGKYLCARSEYNKLCLSTNDQEFMLNLGTKMITLLGFITILGLLIERLATGAISIGAFGAIFYSLDDMYSLMEEMLISRIETYHKGLPALKSFIQFVNGAYTEQGEATGTAGRIPFKKMSLESISFIYPNTTRMVLKNISFTIHRNDKIAIVGYNGSGKSTLAKILLGLYSPTEGTILINDDPGIRSGPQNASVMFQQFNRYKETVFNNIWISEATGDESAGEQAKKIASERLRQINLNHSVHVEDTLDILCAREFGGIDLSGGQWQKLATARMLYRDRDFIVLDEPTAEIDPVSESQMFRLFESEMRNRTAIIITHRMTSIRFCNKIIVLRDGAVDAIGDHETLMKTSDLYYALYHSIEERYH
jgi:ATP-binding cassette subfamily B protein